MALFQNPNLTSKQWHTVRCLRKRIVFLGYFQSACAILGALILVIPVYMNDIDLFWENIFLVFGLAMFLLPGCVLAFFLYRLKSMLGENGYDKLHAMTIAAQAIAPGWGIIIAFLTSDEVREDINRYAPPECTFAEIIDENEHEAKHES